MFKLTKYFKPWVRAILYLVIFFFGIPLFLALRISHINPGSIQFYRIDKNTNPLPFPAQIVQLITDDGVSIRGWHAASNSTNRIVIIIHGFGLSHLEMIERWKGIYPNVADVFFIDLRNHGLSDNSLTTFGYRESLDVQAAVHYFSASYDEIILWGMSMGAAAALRAALLEHRINKLILEGLYDDLSNAICRQVSKMYIPKFPIVYLSLIFYEYLSRVDLDDMNMVNNLKQLENIPILLVHSRADQEVPMPSFYRLRNALGSKGEILLLSEGSHETIYDHNTAIYQRRVIEFIVAKH